MSWEMDEEAAFKRVYEEEKNQYEILHKDPPRQSREDLRAFVESLDLSKEEFTEAIGDPERFKKIYSVVIELRELGAVDYADGIWNEAETIFSRREARCDNLLDRISDYHNSRQPRAIYPKEVKPAKIFKKIHKSRSKSKGSMHTPWAEAQIKSAVANQKAREFRETVTDKMAEDALNIEKPSPFDEGF